jgi:hypothetical protein
VFDLNTDKLVLAKVVRRKTFITGKSWHLVRQEVAVMDDGTVRVIGTRRPEHFLPGAPVVVSFVSRRTCEGDNFPQTVQRIREAESAYITEELPEEA